MTTSLILKNIDLMLAAAQANGVEMPLTTVTRELMPTDDVDHCAKRGDR
jgi:3-hydroxyisobutyrate dehydrogenase-like beta-hydroxyacid dehydrogenase